MRYVVINLLINLILIPFMRFHVEANTVSTGPFYVKKDVVPSYLSHEIRDYKEPIFPKDIRIKMSLSKIDGTLFYSIDKNRNQLIINLQHSVTPRIDIEFRKQHFQQSINKLCGCTLCQYEKLDLRIQILETIILQCNNKPSVYFQYNDIILINTKYPIPIMDPQSTDKKAFIWFVNHPIYNSLLPNRKQLSGCIFDILYNNVPIPFTDISDKIVKECKKTCLNSVCNEGECYETYNDAPLCNCTFSFQNGIHCNDTIWKVNQRTKSQQFQFESFKVSWNSMEKEILLLDSHNFFIRLYREGNGLMFDFSMKSNTIIRQSLMKEYQQAENYILIGKFINNGIEIEFLFRKNRTRSIIYTNQDIKTETFKSLLLRSGNGFIDFVYKRNSLDIPWTKLVLINADPLGNDSFLEHPSSIFISNIQENKNVNAILTVMIIFILITTAVVAWLFYHFRKIIIGRLLEIKISKNVKIYGPENNPLLNQPINSDSDKTAKDKKVESDLTTSTKCAPTSSENNPLLSPINNSDSDKTAKDKDVESGGIIDLTTSTKCTPPSSEPFLGNENDKNDNLPINYDKGDDFMLSKDFY